MGAGHFLLLICRRDGRASCVQNALFLVGFSFTSWVNVALRPATHGLWSSRLEFEFCIIYRILKGRGTEDWWILSLHVAHLEFPPKSWRYWWEHSSSLWLSATPPSGWKRICSLPDTIKGAPFWISSQNISGQGTVIRENESSCNKTLLWTGRLQNVLHTSAV